MQRGNAGLVEAGDEGRYVAVDAEGVDGRELGGNGRRAEGFDAGLVHEAAVQGGDLLLLAGTGRAGAAGIVDDTHQLRQGVVAELVERAPRRAIGRDLVGCQPLGVDRPVHVVLRADGAGGRCRAGHCGAGGGGVRSCACSARHGSAGGPHSRYCGGGRFSGARRTCGRRRGRLQRAAGEQKAEGGSEHRSAARVAASAAIRSR
jgi:hypothetical protein